MKSQIKQETSQSSGEQAILEAAEKLFSEKGFDAVSMSAIAALAKTSKPNIYHHFKNKNDLYLAVMKTAVHRSAELLDALEDAPGTLQQHLADFASGQLNNIFTHKSSTQLMLRETLSGDSPYAAEIAKHAMGEVFSRLIDMVQNGQQAEEFRTDVDPTLAAFMIVAANMFFFQASPTMQHIPEARLPADAEVYSQGVMDILFNGLLPRGDEK